MSFFTIRGFDNLSGRDISGMVIGDFIFDDIKSKLQDKVSQFICMIDRDDLAAIIGEQKLGMAGITDDYSTFKQLNCVHYLIFGKLSLWGLTKVRRELNDKDGLIKDMISEIDNEMVQKILNKIDTAKDAFDPVDLIVFR